MDTGPLWFVGVLLIFSLGYAAWVAVRPRSDDPTRAPRPVTFRALLVITAVVAVSSFLVRLVWP